MDFRINETKKSLLLEEGIYQNSKQFNQLCSFLSNIEKYKDQKNQLSISDTLINQEIHTLELANWLKIL